MQPTILLSDAACHYIQKQLAKEGGIGFRLSVKKTGCSGYSYLPTVVKKKLATDVVMQLEGLTIFIDSTWLHLLQDLHVDYVEEDKLGLKQKRLVFTNPKESSRCGCGESFHVE